MLQQQLRQKDEDIAAKAAEIGELKERVAELEKLKQQQDQLLSMKDSELAAAQQRLADARTVTPPPPAAPATTAQAAQAAQPTEQPQSSSPMPWLWGSLGLVVMALLAWLFVRRTPKTTPKSPPRRGCDSSTRAASMAAPTLDDAPAPAIEADADPGEMLGDLSLVLGEHMHGEMARRLEGREPRDPGRGRSRELRV